jgi:3-dehydrotetronate 4-kinase
VLNHPLLLGCIADDSTGATDLANNLVRLGVGQLVVAGGETSGACVQALGVVQMQIGSQIDPGVPWCHAKSTMGGLAGAGGLHLALKSGNFGSDDFFTKAFTLLATS